ncbi:ABC transporter permease [Candidatus Sodalis endolongispinus]|nr:ABC transporter permease subunit [Candidatus Sodalis endolongispinus]
MVFWSKLGMAGQAVSKVISHAVVFAAIRLAFISLGFRSVDRQLVEVATTLGATGRDVLHTVVLPTVVPHVCSWLVFVFISSLNEYIIAYLVAGFQVETLPIKVFNSLRMGFQPTMCVSAVLFLLVDILAFSLIARIGNLPRLMGGGG